MIGNDGKTKNQTINKRLCAIACTRLPIYSEKGPLFVTCKPSYIITTNI